jgi:hypothetical protein
MRGRTAALKSSHLRGEAVHRSYGCCFHLCRRRKITSRQTPESSQLMAGRTCSKHAFAAISTNSSCVCQSGVSA